MGDVYDQCPRCSDDLKWGATSCHCGWKKRKRGEERGLPPRVPVQCAYDGCTTDATIRVMTVTGWANLCRSHYDAHHGRMARSWCAERGLGTVSQMRAYIRETLAQITSAKPSREWMDTINQRGVDTLITMGDRRMLDELRERGVIEDDGRVIPRENRGPEKALPAPREEATT